MKALVSDACRTLQWAMITVRKNLTAVVAVVCACVYPSGISEHNVTQLFQSFKQVESVHRQYGGTGLGLVISKVRRRILRLARFSPLCISASTLTVPFMLL